MLRDISGFAEHQEKGTYGLGYKQTLTKNSDNAVLNKGNAINNAKIKTIASICMHPRKHHHLRKKKI